MSSIAEIKSHINSVEKTHKITNAMYLIASTKLQKARKELENARPYFDVLKTQIEHLVDETGLQKSKYFDESDVSQKDSQSSDVGESPALIVITGDKGLAGVYNENIIKAAVELMNKASDPKLYIVGEVGRFYCINHDIPMENKSFMYSSHDPTFKRAREIASVVMDSFRRGEVDRVILVYTDMESATKMTVKTDTILPFKKGHFSFKKRKRKEAKYEYLPDPVTVLETMVNSYIKGYVYGALVNSYCSEQMARMTAMDAANDNAQELLGELGQEFHMARQAAITREITEISAGALAMKKKDERK